MNRTFQGAWLAALALACAGALAADEPAKQGSSGAQGKATTPAQQQTRAEGDQAGGNAGSAGSSSRKSNADTRDWAAIDTDKDGLVSGDEMEKYLQANTNAKK